MPQSSTLTKVDERNTVEGNRIGSMGAQFFTTRLILARARWFDSSSGKWVSRDPLLYIDSNNLYHYALSLPHTLTDPTGKSVGAAVSCLYECWIVAFGPAAQDALQSFAKGLISPLGGFATGGLLSGGAPFSHLQSVAHKFYQDTQFANAMYYDCLDKCYNHKGPGDFKWDLEWDAFSPGYKTSWKKKYGPKLPGWPKGPEEMPPVDAPGEFPGVGPDGEFLDPEGEKDAWEGIGPNGKGTRWVPKPEGPQPSTGLSGWEIAGIGVLAVGAVVFAPEIAAWSGISALVLSF